MPFITEELWQRLPSKKEYESIMIARYPEVNMDWEDEKIETEFEIIYKIIRLLKNNYNLNNSKKPNIILLINNEKNYFKLLKNQSSSIKV
jgi:valyl-tRNA synthetase